MPSQESSVATERTLLLLEYLLEKGASSFRSVDHDSRNSFFECLFSTVEIVVTHGIQLVERTLPRSLDYASSLGLRLAR